MIYKTLKNHESFINKVKNFDKNNIKNKDKKKIDWPLVIRTLKQMKNVK